MKKVTILDIANELDVTFSTVARALNDHPAISEATKKTVRAKAEELGYRKNRIASSLRSGVTNTIGIMVPALDVTFFAAVVHGIEKTLNKKGYGILLTQSDEKQQREEKCLETLLNSRVDGIITSVAIDREDPSIFREIIKRKIPLAFFDRAIEELPVPSVTVDDYRGGYLATEHLIKMGYRKICHLTEARSLPIFSKRTAGYLDALNAYQLPIREELILRGERSLEFGENSVEYLLGAGIEFDAVFALEDYTAMGALKALGKHNKRIPEDYGVIGFANEAFGNLVTPSLSTIDQHSEEMGEKVANLFLELIKDGRFYENEVRRLQLNPTLMSRESSRRLPL